MQTIFVTVKCELGRAYQVVDEAVQTIGQVSEVHSISGQYDLLLECFLGEEEDIGHFVAEQFQRLPGRARHLHADRLQGLLLTS